MKLSAKVLLVGLTVFGSTLFCSAHAQLSGSGQPAKTPPAKEQYKKNSIALTGAEADDQFMNLRISPLGLILGYINVDVDFKMSEMFTLGPTFSYWNVTLGDASVKATAFGARGNWYFDGFHHDGVYATGYGQFAKVSATQKSSLTGQTLTAETSGFVITGLVGYHWFWSSFNQSVGAGIGVSSFPDKIKVRDSSGSEVEVSVRSSRAGLALEYMLGWTF